jgi:hypothetical protein
MEPPMKKLDTGITVEDGIEFDEDDFNDALNEKREVHDRKAETPPSARSSRNDVSATALSSVRVEDGIEFDEDDLADALG